MYKTGDYVICRSGGVWRIDEYDGSEYLLHRHGAEETKRVAADSEELVRPAASAADINEAIERVGFIRTVNPPTERMRMSFYEQCMAEFDDAAWISVIKSVYLRSGEHRAAPQEEKLAACAKDFFHSEVSAVLGIPLFDVEEYIKKRVEEDNW